MKNILPHSTFHSADYFQDEKKLLQKCWFFAGLKSQLQNSQDYITAEHFGFPVVIINSENQYRGFANRCLHRGSPIVKINSCGTGALKCQYHGWLYHNDGNIKAIPFANSFPETPKGKLNEIKVETCGEFFMPLKKIL
jgi:phenylpropionate dioxygenase-like ring-hydroxylating dioxygenase large terminal subunit